MPAQVRDSGSPRPLLIAVTASGGTYTRHDALGPFDIYLTKPTDPFGIAALIEPLGRRPSRRVFGLTHAAGRAPVP